MKATTFKLALGSALLLSSQPALASLHGHRLAHSHYSKRHNHSHGQALQLEEHLAEQPIEKRATCALPKDPDVIPVPGASNGGWAIAPDRSCVAGSYCPYSCAPGKVMAQWKPNTIYRFPESMAGGLFCDGSGTPKKAFTDKPYCVDGTGAVNAVNTCGKVVSFCQTTLPGDESMVTKTDVFDKAVLAVPGPSYWAGTAAHYYVNPPGVDGSIGCNWGGSSQPHGNWSPFIAGANTVANGQTFVTVGWNPKFVGSGLERPSYGLRIECDGCNGAPCEIHPGRSNDFSVKSPVAAKGAGGAAFCTVTVPKGGSADIVIFNTDGSSGSASSSSPSSSDAAAPSPSSYAASSSSESATSVVSSYSSSSSSSSFSAPSASALPGGLFHENGTFTSTSGTSSTNTTATQGTTEVTSGTSSASPSSSTSPNGAVSPGREGAAVAGLVIAVGAGLWLY